MIALLLLRLIVVLPVLCWAENRQVMAPKHLVGPSYPRLAQLSRIQGSVTLRATVDRGGQVKDVAIVSGHPLLVEASKNALLEWKFEYCKPARKSCTATVQFQFSLAGVCELEFCQSSITIDLPDTVIIRTKALRAIID